MLAPRTTAEPKSHTPAPSLQRKASPLVPAKAAAPVRAVPARPLAPARMPAPAAQRMVVPPKAEGSSFFDSPRKQINYALSNDLPGWDLITSMLGYNPILNESVRRDSGTILYHILHLDRVRGPRLYQRMMADGFIQEMLRWTTEHTRNIDISLPALKRATDKALDGLGWQSIEKNVDAVKDAFRPLVEPVLQLGEDLLDVLLEWLRKAVLRPLAAHARKEKGYKLLTLALGEDPITHAPVEQSLEALGHTLLSFLPAGEEYYQRFKQANALEALPAWLNRELAKRKLNAARLQGLLTGTLEQLQHLNLNALLSPVQTAVSLVGPYFKLAADVLGLLVTAELALLKLVVEAVLGPSAKDLFKLLDQGGDLLLRILKKPLPFLKALVKAGKEGFMSFLHEVPTHLKNAFQKWILGPMEKEGLDIPKTWNLKGAVHLLLQVLGLTKEYVMKQLEKRVRAELGPEAVERIQQVGGPLLTLLNEGPAALWKQISDQAGDLVKAAFDSIKGKLLSMLGVGVAKFLAKLAIPGGAIVQVLESTYDVYQTVVARAKEIIKVGMTLFNAAQSLEQGNTSLAAKSIEGVLSQMLPVALDFLARTFKLDKLPVLVRAALKALRTPVDKGINWVVDKIIAFAKLAWQALKAGGKAVVQAGRDAVGAVKGWLGLRQPFTNPEGEQHTLFLEQGTNGPRMMVASTPQALESYLIAARATATPRELDLIDKAEAARQQLAMYTVDVDGPAVAQQVKSLLMKISWLLARIGGERMKTLELPADPGWGKMPGVAKGSEVQHVSSRTAHVGGSIKRASPNGWDLIRRGGLSLGSYWVKLHMISDKLGGPPSNDNLIPAPGAINSGPVLNFETQAKDLITTPQKIPRPPRRRGVVAPPPALPVDHADKSPVVLWITSQVTGFYGKGQASVLVSPGSSVYKQEDYGDKDFASGIELQAGLVIYNPTLGSGNEWERDNTVLIRANVAIPKPNWKKQDPPSIHFMSRTSLMDITGCSEEFADLVKQTIKDPITGANIPYSDSPEFSRRMNNAQKQAKLRTFTDDLAKVETALNSKVISLSTTV